MIIIFVPVAILLVWACIGIHALIGDMGSLILLGCIIMGIVAFWGYMAYVNSE